MNPTRRLRDRKRQARLTFSPLPSSAPAAAQLSASVRSRAAAVAYVGAPVAKKRRLGGVDVLSGGDYEDEAGLEGSADEEGGLVNADEDENENGNEEGEEGQAEAISKEIMLPTPTKSSQVAVKGEIFHVFSLYA